MVKWYTEWRADTPKLEITMILLLSSGLVLFFAGLEAPSLHYAMQQIRYHRDNTLVDDHLPCDRLTEVPHTPRRPRPFRG